ncbi:unnamed protein product, partial [Adineta ricciae]
MQINWLRHDQIINDVNILTKTYPIDHQCSETIMEIVDLSEYQFGRYECQAENILGRNSVFVDVEQSSRIVKTKHYEHHANEFNRNGRTALLIDKDQQSNNTHSILRI